MATKNDIENKKLQTRLLFLLNNVEGGNYTKIAATAKVPINSLSSLKNRGTTPRAYIISKLLLAYPHYNSEWLIKGTGSIFVDPKHPSPNPPNPINSQIDPFDSIWSKELDLKNRRIQKIENELSLLRQKNNELRDKLNKMLEDKINDLQR